LLGRAEQTWPAIEKAMHFEQSDRRHSIWFCFAGFAELLLGRTEQAIPLLQKSLERNPSYGFAQLFLMAALGLIGHRAEAGEIAASFRKQYPDYRTSTFEQLWLSALSAVEYCSGRRTAAQPYRRCPSAAAYRRPRRGSRY
jgi:tetratricopeptide (TPR) repeat protein